MLIDAQLEIKDSEFPIKGESLDAVGRESDMIHIYSFDLAPQKKDSYGGDFDEEEEKKRKRKKKQRAGTHSFIASITKELDNSSPDLLWAYCRYIASPDKCKPLQSARVLVRKAGGDQALVFLEFVLRNLYVVSYKLKADDGAKPPKEDIEFGFEYCEMIYRSQNPDGTQRAPNSKAYDFAKDEGES